MRLRGHDKKKRLLGQLVPELLPRVLTGDLLAIVREAGGLYEKIVYSTIESEVRKRLAKTTRLRELTDLLQVAEEIGMVHHAQNDMANLIEQLDVQRLVPRTDAGKGELHEWLIPVINRLERWADLKWRLLAALDPSLLVTLYGDELFGLNEEEYNAQSIAHRLRTKALVLKAIGQYARAAALDTLERHLERDALMVFWVQLNEPVWSANAWQENVRQTPAWEWLEEVETISPELAQIHINTLLAYPYNTRDTRTRIRRVEEVILFVRTWLETRHQELSCEQMHLLLEHLDRLPGADTETAAALASSSLPTSPELRRWYREEAVRRVKIRLERAPSVAWTRTLQELDALLGEEAPDLQQELHQWRGSH